MSRQGEDGRTEPECCVILLKCIHQPVNCSTCLEVSTGAESNWSNAQVLLLEEREDRKTKFPN